MKKNTVIAIVALAAVAATSGSALLANAAKPDFAGKDLTHEERIAAIKAANESRMADLATANENRFQELAQQAMDRSVALSERLQAKAAELGIVVPTEVLGSFNSLMLEAQTAYDAGDYKLAMQKANEAKGALEALDALIEAAEAEQEALEEDAENSEE